jgi:hypothetical protein
MGARRPSLVLAILLVPTLAYAGHHNFSVFIAPSGDFPQNNPDTNNNSIWNGGLSARQDGGIDDGFGWHVAGEITFKPKKALSFILDTSAHLVGAEDATDATQITVMLGPRFSVPILTKGYTSVHVLMLGATHVSDNRLDLSATTASIAVGVGFDFYFKQRRDPTDNHVTEGHQGVRVQLDRIFTAGDRVAGSWRLSAGWVYKFFEE